MKSVILSKPSHYNIQIAYIHNIIPNQHITQQVFNILHLKSNIHYNTTHTSCKAHTTLILCTHKSSRYSNNTHSHSITTNLLHSSKQCPNTLTTYSIPSVFWFPTRQIYNHIMHTSQMNALGSTHRIVRMENELTLKFREINQQCLSRTEISNFILSIPK